MAICFPLSWKLLIYALETLFVASDKTPAKPGVKRWRPKRKRETRFIPARVRFPLRVKLVLRAPVPAYILDSASPFSAHNSRWYDHSAFEFTHSRRTRSRYCSTLVRDRMSCTKLVRSKLSRRVAFCAPRQRGADGERTEGRTNQDSSYGRRPSVP